jgi:hypothetical protein
MPQDPRTWSAFQALHQALCAQHAIEPGRGSQTRVAEALGLPVTSYSAVLAGERGSLELLVRWAGQIGLTVIIPPHGPIRFERAAPQPAVAADHA